MRRVNRGLVVLALVCAMCANTLGAYALDTPPARTPDETIALSAESSVTTVAAVEASVIPTVVPVNRRVEDDELFVKYTGRWRSMWDRAVSGDSVHRSTFAGSSARLAFIGERVDLVSTVGPDKGSVRILLDGVEKATVSLYAGVTAHEAVVWSSGTLPPGTHNVTVVVLGTTTAGSTGISGVIDAFDIHGVPLDSGTYGGYIIDQTNRLLGRSGAWAFSARGAAVGGGSRRTTASGTWYQVAFKGTGARWIGRKDAAGGLAAIYLDGHRVDTVSCYSPTTAERRVMWEVSGLGYGNHLLRVYVLGQPSEVAGGRGVDVDTFVVAGRIGFAPRPTPFKYPWRTYIIIDKSSFKLYWVKNGMLIKEYPIAHGKVTSPTPSRTWRIDAKYLTDPSSVYGPRKMRMFKRVRTSSGTRYVFSAYAIHGTNQEWVIGTQASHGCIRMYNRDVRELFPQVPYRTMVVTRD